MVPSRTALPAWRRRVPNTAIVCGLVLALSCCGRSTPPTAGDHPSKSIDNDIVDFSLPAILGWVHKTLNAPTVVAPICEGTSFVVIRDSIPQVWPDRNGDSRTTVQVLRNGQVVGSKNAEAGDLRIDVGPTWQRGDQVTALQFLGHKTSPMSASVTVGCNAVITQRMNNNRTSWQPHETALTPDTVRNNFGRVITRDVDGQIYTQPLYVPGVSIPGNGTHNVIYVATEHNSVYAFDADYPHISKPLWFTSLGTPVPQPDVGSDCHDLEPEIGVTSTPVIDLNTNTMYIVAKIKLEGSDSRPEPCPVDPDDPDAAKYAIRLHALDLSTKQEKFGGPVNICGSITFNGNQTATFSALKNHQRASLLLNRGTVFIGFGSHCDNGKYHGWVFAYDASTLKRVGFVTTTPTGHGGSIWQAATGLAADDGGNVYAMTGNGSDHSYTYQNMSESFVRLSWLAGRNLQWTGYFRDTCYSSLNFYDRDLGASGPVVIPGLYGGKKLIVGGGKQGLLWVLDRLSMQPVFKIQVSDHPNSDNIHGAPAYWNGPTGPTLYVMPEQNPLKRYQILDNAAPPAADLTKCDDGMTPVNTVDAEAPITWIQSSTITAPGDSMPGGFISISSDGTRNGIVWVAVPFKENANNGGPVRGVLRAFNAEDITDEIWDTTRVSWDELGGHAKFVVPTVADGQVFIPSFGGARDELVVEGIHVHSHNALQIYGMTCHGGCPDGYECVHGEYRSVVHPGCAPNSCGVPDGLGGSCECMPGAICNPTTQTCCNWSTQCARQGPCSWACRDEQGMGVECPCSEGGLCFEGRCCQPHCNASCGGVSCGLPCIGRCSVGSVCTARGTAAACEPLNRFCDRLPGICAESPNGDPSAFCEANPRACAWDLDHGFRGNTWRAQHPDESIR